MKLWNPTLRIVDDSLWYILVRWDRYDWNECSVRSIRVKCDFHKLCFHKYFVNIVHCSILLRSDNCVHVNVPYTAYPRYHITSQRVSPYITTVSRILFRGHPRILFSNILACRRGLGNCYSWYNCSWLLVRNVCRACLQQVCYNWVRK